MHGGNGSSNSQYTPVENLSVADRIARADAERFAKLAAAAAAAVNRSQTHGVAPPPPPPPLPPGSIHYGSVQHQFQQDQPRKRAKVSKWDSRDRERPRSPDVAPRKYADSSVPSPPPHFSNGVGRFRDDDRRFRDDIRHDRRRGPFRR